MKNLYVTSGCCFFRLEERSIPPLRSLLWHYVWQITSKANSNELLQEIHPQGRQSAFSRSAPSHRRATRCSRFKPVHNATENHWMNFLFQFFQKRVSNFRSLTVAVALAIRTMDASIPSMNTDALYRAGNSATYIQGVVKHNISNLIRKDFQESNVVVVNGRVLSKTERAICAIIGEGMKAKNKSQKYWR